MGLLKRVLGICRTQPPTDRDCWKAGDGKIEVDLARAAELGQPGGAIRLEGGGLADRVLLLKADDGVFHAFVNKCSHAGRRLDPLPGEALVECCSVGKSRFDYTGERRSGSAKKAIKSLQVEAHEGKLIISLP
jgi:nitrite reductase/ring-hydroxylating ferredoxin subunit